MAETSNEAVAEKREQEARDAAEAVTTRDVGRVLIECPADVDLIVDGKRVEPGDTAWVEGPSAINLIALGHGIPVDSELPKGVKRAVKKGGKK